MPHEHHAIDLLNQDLDELTDFERETHTFYWAGRLKE